MAGSAESIETTPATETTKVVAVRGGGINLNCSLTNAWLLKPEIVACRQFVRIDTQDRRCKTYLRDDFAMVYAIQTLRNRKVAELMRALPTGPKTYKKRELIGRLPPIITVEVATADGLWASVGVLPSCRDFAMLKIELTTTNMDLLREDPAATWAPYIEQPNVFWLARNDRVACHWWDCKKNKWRTKTRLVQFATDMDGRQKQQLVNEKSSDLQCFFEKTHDRATCSDDSAEYDESYESAETIPMLDCGNNVLEPAPEEKLNPVAEATAESVQASAESAQSEANPFTV